MSTNPTNTNLPRNLQEFRQIVDLKVIRNPLFNEKGNAGSGWLVISRRSGKVLCRAYDNSDTAHITGAAIQRYNFIWVFPTQAAAGRMAREASWAGWLWMQRGEDFMRRKSAFQHLPKFEKGTDASIPPGYFRDLSDALAYRDEVDMEAAAPSHHEDGWADEE